jgi:hypothetical protein
MITFDDVRRYAQEYVNRPYAFGKEDFIKVVEEYVNSLPEWKRESIIGIQKEVNGVKVTKAVKKKDLPKILREDEEFFNTIVRIWASR